MFLLLTRAFLLRVLRPPPDVKAISKPHLRSRVNMTSTNLTYRDAIAALNTLQSNATYIQKARTERTHNPEINIHRTVKHLRSLGIVIKDLNSLNIIHVSGTKGKGSTCALTESILRQHGTKTGFYSSPHLVYVNERIRINGQPLPKPMFSSYFWHVYNTLQKSLEDNEKMPSYFMFLTVMAFYVFLKERVDVAIIEVGIGGLYDCTNVIEKPVAVGVATLGLDHVQLLGNTIEQIARQKAGIFKPSVPAFTVSQPESALTILWNHAQLVGCPLHVVPPLEVYEQDAQASIPEDLGMVQNLNASLAIQLSNVWLQKREPVRVFHSDVILNHSDDKTCRIPLAPLFPLNPVFVRGIMACSWPGRFHIVKKENFTFYLDGAHTQQSMKHCVRWFQEVSKKEKSLINGKVCQVLLFNCTGERTAEVLLDPLSNIPFDIALFTPNRLMDESTMCSDQSNLTVDITTEANRCQANHDVWCHMMKSYHEDAIANASQSINFRLYTDPESARIFSCLGRTLKWVLEKDGLGCDNLQRCLGHADHYQILVTGSLHLVGGVLSIIETSLDT